MPQTIRRNLFVPDESLCSSVIKLCSWCSVWGSAFGPVCRYWGRPNDGPDEAERGAGQEWPHGLPLQPQRPPHAPSQLGVRQWHHNGGAVLGRGGVMRSLAPVSLGLFEHSCVSFPHWLPRCTVDILCLSVTGCVVVYQLMLSLELWISTKRIKKISWKDSFICLF